MISLPTTITEIPSGAYAGIYTDEFVGQLVSRPKANTLSFPSVECKNSLPSCIAMMHPVVLPDGQSRAVGINLDVVPQKSGTDYGYFVSINDVRFQGFQDHAATKPLFHTGRVTTTIPAGAQPLTGYYCFNVPAPQKLGNTYDADGRRSASVADANERQLLFVKTTLG